MGRGHNSLPYVLRALTNVWLPLLRRYWAHPDQTGSIGHSMTVAACGALCGAKPACLAFNVYDPNQVTQPLSAGGSACYTYSTTRLASFTNDARGLIRTCVKA